MGTSAYTGSPFWGGVLAGVLAGPLFPEASGAARSGFVAALFSGVVLLDDRTAAAVWALFTVTRGPLAGGR